MTVTSIHGSFAADRSRLALTENIYKWRPGVKDTWIHLCLFYSGPSTYTQKSCQSLEYILLSGDTMASLKSSHQDSFPVCLGTGRASPVVTDAALVHSTDSTLQMLLWSQNLVSNTSFRL